jgi:hypothetical protein
MKTIKVILALSAFWMLGGCVAVPVGSGYYPGPQSYSQPAPAGPPDYPAAQGYAQPPAPAYYGPSVYYGPPVGYYGPPAYYGPSFGIGIYGGRGGYRRWR